MANAPREGATDHDVSKNRPMTGSPDKNIRLDWSVEFTSDEWEKLAAKYSNGHGLGDMRFVPFIPMFYKLRPDALKRYKLYGATVEHGVGLSRPMNTIIPLAMHHYILDRYPLGYHYTLVATRRMGISKAEISDIFALAFFHGGAPPANALAEAVDHEIGLWAPDWEPNAQAPGFPWPEGWEVDAEAFACGIDFIKPHDNDLSPSDLDLIEDWHRKVEGDVPAFVRFAAKNNPLQLLAFRARFEQTMQGHLPKQYIALARLELAGFRRDSNMLRRAIHMARHFSVPRDQVVQALGHLQMHGDIGMDTTMETAAAILEEWSV
jgi:hypothetical protein